MVLVTVGSTMNDFKRLFIKIDEMVAAGELKDVFAQIGVTSYRPENYEYTPFMDISKFDEYINKSDFIICHAGSGTLNKCLGFRKKVITVPRLAELNEHPDNHQLELAAFLSGLNRVLCVTDIETLPATVEKLNTWEPSFRENPAPPRIMESIEEYINTTFPIK